jgi:dTDP-4-dehydrorhamnose reductase
MHIVIFGGTGMLGSMLVDVLSRESQLSITATAQSPEQLTKCKSLFKHVKWCEFRITETSTVSKLTSLDAADWYINCIGLTKPYIRENNFAEISKAIRINASWPLELAEFAGSQGAKVLQIGTDCVFQGLKGNYLESDLHDASDVYGKTKSLGEAVHPAMFILRTSIIGPEPQDNAFLLAWLLGQPLNGSVNGFTNHLWNGVTTLQFARVAAGIIKNNPVLPRIQHLVPGDIVSKAQLLNFMKQSFQRTDITVTPTVAAKVIDRTLSTAFPESNIAIWKSAGYPTPPTIASMVDELAKHPYTMAKNSTP